MKAREAKALKSRDDERPSKHAKISQHEMFLYDSKHRRAIMESAQEGIFDRLRKTVEDLGVRVGKTVGKSIGSNIATVLAEVAEARAAAKARVAERHRKEEVLTMALPAPETVEHETGTSTTPPLQSHSSAMPSGPVFKKPSPVFVPPAQVATEPIASTVLKSTGQSTTALGLPPCLTSSLSKVLPLAAQSTHESIGSDAVFDRDDVPAWMPETRLSISEKPYCDDVPALMSSTQKTGKKGKQPEVKKVLQMAAVAAKKVDGGVI
jgi:hypothetical protein